MNRESLENLLRCPTPSCGAPLSFSDDRNVKCAGCGADYPQKGSILHFVPKESRSSLPAWSTWEVLQSNGQVSYTQDPQNNLGVGERPDCHAFSRFCNLEGLVLDIGCGPQGWPAYIDSDNRNISLIGIDPLEPHTEPQYTRLCGLGEFLPFRSGVFDSVILATSLDHMMDAVAVLQEAKRVARSGGQIVIWSGEKKPGAPRPEESPEWYVNLQVPEDAEDPFHFHRFTEEEIQNLIRSATLEIAEHDMMPVDAWRTNHFYRCKAA